LKILPRTRMKEMKCRGSCIYCLKSVWTVGGIDGVHLSLPYNATESKQRQTKLKKVSSEGKVDLSSNVFDDLAATCPSVAVETLLRSTSRQRSVSNDKRLQFSRQVLQAIQRATFETGRPCALTRRTWRCPAVTRPGPVRLPTRASGGVLPDPAVALHPPRSPSLRTKTTVSLRSPAQNLVRTDNRSAKLVVWLVLVVSHVETLVSMFFNQIEPNALFIKSGFA